MNCRVHGDLTEDQTVKSGRKANGEQRLRCNLCYKESSRIYYIKHKEKILAKNKKWRKENPDLNRKIKRESEKKNREKHRHQLRLKHKKYRERNPEAVKRKNEKKVREIRDSYVNEILRRGTDLKPEDIPKDLIEAKRSCIKIKRIIRKRDMYD